MAMDAKIADALARLTTAINAVDAKTAGAGAAGVTTAKLRKFQTMRVK